MSGFGRVKRQRPGMGSRGVVLGRVPDDDLLSRGLGRTIIGVLPFHGPVRDGKGWFQQAVVVRRRGREGKDWG